MRACRFHNSLVQNNGWEMFSVFDSCAKRLTVLIELRKPLALGRFSKGTP